MYLQPILGSESSCFFIPRMFAVVEEKTRHTAVFGGSDIDWHGIVQIYELNK